MHLLPLLLTAAAPAPASATAALAVDRPLAIKAVQPDRASAPVCQRITLDLDVEASYTNPFDSSQVAVEAEVTPPSGAAWRVPGFLAAPHRHELVEGRERVTADGAPRWQVRLALVEPGAHRVVVTARDRSGTVSAPAVTLTGEAADASGYVRLSPTDRHYFVTDRGESYFPIGANVCWGGGRGTFDFDTWLPKYAAAGGNYFRIWLAPQRMTLSLQTPGSGYHGIDLPNASKVDRVLELAERLGLRVLFCIDSFNILRHQTQQYGWYEESPYPKANGGPLDNPQDYFTNETMRRAYRDRLRYLVGRWGYSPNVFAWEFWNEVDIISNYRSAEVTDWHRDMARYLRGLDPWRHLITTSTANHAGDPRLDALPELEFVQTHHYGSQDVVATLGNDRRTKRAAQDRPHYHGEFGINGGGGTAQQDPTGIHLHNAVFSCVGQMQAGVPMTWWWDSYVEPKSLYPIYGAFAKWIEGFDFVAQKARPVEATVAFANPDAQPQEPGGKLAPENAAWTDHELNQPTTVRVDARGRASFSGPLSRVLHGTRNHPTWHNPVTFELDVPRATTFGVQVDGVSRHGGARLAISLDGQVVREELFEDLTRPAEGDFIRAWDGAYRIDLPAGRHTVKVENTGADWLFVAYDIPWYRPTAEPSLRVLGVVGESRALVWLQNRFHTWARVTAGETVKPVTGALVAVGALAPGRWRVEWFDTHAGQVTETETREVGADGRLSLELPEVAWDVALRLVKE